MSCNCASQSTSGNAKSKNTVLNVSWLEREANETAQSLMVRSRSINSLAQDDKRVFELPRTATNLTITEDGDRFLSTHFSLGASGDVVIRGALGAFPFDAHLHVSLDAESASISVTLSITKPIALGPYTWKFDLHGVVRSTSGEIIGASSISPSQETTTVDRGVWCYIKCGGMGILPVLLACIPSMAGGPAAYVACVVAAVGLGEGASIAKCVAEKCL